MGSVLRLLVLTLESNGGVEQVQALLEHMQASSMGQQLPVLMWALQVCALDLVRPKCMLLLLQRMQVPTFGGPMPMLKLWRARRVLVSTLVAITLIAICQSKPKVPVLQLEPKQIWPMAIWESRLEPVQAKLEQD